MRRPPEWNALFYFLPFLSIPFPCISNNFTIQVPPYHLIKTSTIAHIMGKEFDIIRTYSNYKDFQDGYIFPSEFTLGPIKITIDKILINAEIDPQKFVIKNLSSLVLKIDLFDAFSGMAKSCHWCQM